MVEVGAGAGDPHVQCWGHHGLGVVRVTTGPLDEVAAHLSRARELCITITSYRFQVGIDAQLGKCQLRRGRLNEAEASLNESMALIESKGLRGMWSSDTFNGCAGLWLAKAARLKGTGRRKALGEARRACRRAWRCTRDAVGWLPETQRLQGTLAWLSGKPAKAHAHWRTSLATAERGGMPIERARTLLEMGARLGDGTLVEEARRVFDETGANVDLAFSLHVLACMTAVGADAASAIPQYDQAIAALDIVKAEYNLGLACQERAQLFAKLGRHDEAKADLIRARQCYAAIEADAEKIEVEKLALTMS